MCEFLLRDVEVIQYEVKALQREDDEWIVGEYRVKNIVLTTGYESDLADLRYMDIRGKWGTRGDFSSALDLKMSMHQTMSVGSNVGGIIKLGATHEREVKKPIPCSKQEAQSLKQKAS